MLSFHTTSNAPPDTIYLHGFLGNRHDWPNSTAAEKAMFIDLPGHGKSCDEKWLRPYSFRDVLTALITMTQSLDPFNLVGYSMGARIALMWALEQPEKIKTLTLHGVTPGIESEVEKKQRLKNDESWAEKFRENLGQTCQDWYQQEIFMGLSETERNKRIEKRKQNNADGIAQALISMSTGHQPNLWSLLKNLNCPVRLIVGEYDKKFVEIAKRAQTQMKNCQIETISKSDHWTVDNYYR